jgi:hypothetical protein
MATFRPGPGLNERVAARWAVPEAHRLADMLAERVRANAPDARVWITKQDEKVRPTHVKADGQTIPTNLRFVLDHPSSVQTSTAAADRSGTSSPVEGGEQELARKPRDPDLSIGNRINCRCIDAGLPGLIAQHVAAGDVVQRGPQATATVSVTFSRIVESEHPGPEDGGGGWLARSVDEARGQLAL